MATYRAIASTETDPQAPVTSALMKALEANPTAIAEGALNAPKVKGQALDVILPYVTATGATATAGWTSGLDRASWIEIDFAALNAGLSNAVRARLSSDGGSSWSAFSGITISFSAGSLTGRTFINLETGAVYTIAQGEIITTTLAFTGSPNAVQLQMNSGGASVIQLIGKIIGGVSP